MKTLKEMRKDLWGDYRGKKILIKCAGKEEMLRILDEVENTRITVSRTEYHNIDKVAFFDNKAIQYIKDAETKQIIYQNPLVLDNYNGSCFADLIGIVDELIKKGESKDLLEKSLRQMNVEKLKRNWSFGFIAWKMLIKLYDNEQTARKSSKEQKPDLSYFFKEAYQSVLQDNEVKEFLETSTDDDDTEEGEKQKYFGLCLTDIKTILKIVTCHYENKNGQQFDDWWHKRFKNLLKELKITHIDHKNCHRW